MLEMLFEVLCGRFYVGGALEGTLGEVLLEEVQ